MGDRSNYEHSCPNHGPAFDCGVVQALRERIKELEAEVIEARRQGMDDGYMRANIENVGDYMLLQEENQRLREGITLHRDGIKMRAGGLWNPAPEDSELWALLGGGNGP